MNGKEEMAKMYFVAIVLPKHLDEKILAHKQWMKENFDCKVGLKSPAHITLVPPFWMPEEKGAPLRQDLEQLASSTPAFALTTNHFSAFRPRTIFVAVQESEALAELKKKSGSFFRQRDYKMKIENRPFHPHITIATRDLHKKDFAAAWPQFENEKLEERFAATGLSLLKHNGRTWDVIFIAPFSN